MNRSTSSLRMEVPLRSGSAVSTEVACSSAFFSASTSAMSCSLVRVSSGKTDPVNSITAERNLFVEHGTHDSFELVVVVVRIVRPGRAIVFRKWTPGDVEPPAHLGEVFVELLESHEE